LGLAKALVAKQAVMSATGRAPILSILLDLIP
jgi:hypothetical protein